MEENQQNPQKPDKNRLRIDYIPTTEIIPYENNPRKNDKAVETVKKSIQEFGFKNPIILDKENKIVAGHTRLKASKDLGYSEVPVIWADDLTEEQVKAFRIMDNKSHEYSSWDKELLNKEIGDLLDQGINLDITGLNKKEQYDVQKSRQEKADFLVSDLILIPAFSTFDGKSGFWIDRTKKWREVFPLDECVQTREEKLAGKDTVYGAERSVSIFNHTLAEVLTRAFSKEGDTVTIPFCEASIFGVSSVLKRNVHGIELRPDQVKVNNEIIKGLETGNSEVIEGDALDETKYPKKSDFIMSCPPYIGLEKYSDKKEDLSNNSEKEFFENMEKFLQICYNNLKENSFLALVFGNIRQSNGRVINICGKITDLAEKIGFNLYNDIVFLQPRLSTSMRQAQFRKSRKVVRCHEKVIVLKKGEREVLNKPVTKEHDLDNQDVLVFYKGDPKNAKNKAEDLNKHFSDVDYLTELKEFEDYDTQDI